MRSASKETLILVVRNVINSTTILYGGLAERDRGIDHPGTKGVLVEERVV